MKAAVYYTNSDVRVEEVPKPEAGAGELIMKTDTCGICVADTMEWYNKPKAPVVLGHQAVGYVDEVGEGVEDFKVGDRIFVHHHIAFQLMLLPLHHTQVPSACCSQLVSVLQFRCLEIYVQSHISSIQIGILLYELYFHWHQR